MNKQQKVLAAVLGVGLLALGVDRLVLESPATGPHDAAAEQTIPNRPDSLAQSNAMALARDTADIAAVSNNSSPSLAVRLHEAAHQQHLPDEPERDAFAPSDAWMTAITPILQTSEVDEADANTRRFQQTHRLMAVMTPGDRGVVVVNHRAMRVGQRINGFTLVKVEHHNATFLSPDGQVTLKLDP